MTKKSLGVATLTMTILAAGVAWATAQSPGAGSRGQGRGQRMADYLGLSQDQRATWKSLHEQHKTDMEPLRQEGRTLHERLRSALGAASPDPTTVGLATIAMKQHREKVKAANEAFHARLTATLSDEQKTKLEAFRAANRGSHGEGWGSRRGHRGHEAGGPDEGSASAPSPTEG
jgi:Spy/CpxP family protein refolding chaperone